MQISEYDNLQWFKPLPVMFHHLSILFKFTFLKSFFLLQHKVDLDNFIDLAKHVDGACKVVGSHSILLVDTNLFVFIVIWVLLSFSTPLLVTTHLRNLIILTYYESTLCDSSCCFVFLNSSCGINAVMDYQNQLRIQSHLNHRIVEKCALCRPLLLGGGGRRQR